MKNPCRQQDHRKQSHIQLNGFRWNPARAAQNFSGVIVAIVLRAVYAISFSVDLTLLDYSFLRI